MNNSVAIVCLEHVILSRIYFLLFEIPSSREYCIENWNTTKPEEINKAAKQGMSYEKWSSKTFEIL